MSTTVSTAAFNMDALSSLLSPIGSQSNYSNVSASGFTAKLGGFAPAIKVEGSFILIPGTTTIVTGVIAKITVIGLAGGHTITPATDIGYFELLGALGGNQSLLALLLGGKDAITGSGAADLLRGGAEGDAISGGGDNDRLYGEAGGDNLRGNAGDDRLMGGDGFDTLAGGKGLDRLDGGAQNDLVDYSTAGRDVVVSLKGESLAMVKIGGTAVDRIKNIEWVYGGEGDDRLTGDGLGNLLVGNDGKDRLDGGGGVDALHGGARADILIGGAGDDMLEGGPGKDMLTGGKGADNFSFTAVMLGKNSVDTITDFKVGVDHIVLSKGLFHIGLPGGFGGASGYFATGSAKNGDDRIIYKPGIGGLYADADGKGGADGVLFARLDKHLALTESDFSLAF